MIKDLEEKQLQVAYFLSRGNRSVEEKFTEFNICKAVQYDLMSCCRMLSSCHIKHICLL